MKVKKALVHGVALGLGIVVWSQINHLIDSQNTVVGIFFSVTFVTIYVMVTLNLLKGQKINDKNTYWSFLLTGVIAAAFISFSYELLATVIDPTYVNDQIARSRQQWAMLHYSEEQIEEQIEMTDTFQDPTKWSLVLFGFNFSFYLVIGLVMIFVQYIRQEFGAKRDPDSYPKEGN